MAKVLVEEEILENLKTEMKHVLSNYYRKTNTGIDALLKAWLKGKKPLIEMFSKHPNWNPEKLMIQFDCDFSREFNRRAIQSFLCYIETNIKRKHNVRYISDAPARKYYAYILISKINSQFFDDSMDCYINNLNNTDDQFKIRNNMKSSKAIGKIATVLGWDKFPDWNKEYAKVCDALNPIKVKRHTCISLNPIDFLLMSHGNSWHSCHSISYKSLGQGCFTSGTISYMVDTASFLFYTVDGSYDGKYIELEPKLQRQVFGYKPNVILQSRLYPQSMDYGAKDIYTDIREIVQKVIADCLDIPNMWVKKNSVNSYVSKTSRSTAYPDYEYQRGICTISVHKSAVENNVPLKMIKMGRPPICLKCGQKHSVTDRLYCRSCY